jgi:hypothetical protein
VQSIGKILVIWRENPEKPVMEKAPARRTMPGKAPAGAASRISRPRSRPPLPPRESGPRRRRPRTSQ